MILVSAGLLPSQDATANGTNYVTLGIAKGDAAAGSLTSFDTYNTSSTGLTEQSLRAFTIASDDSDTLAKDDYLYVTAAASGSGVAVKAKLVLEYKLSN